jgi:hypothetical protein
MNLIPRDTQAHEFARKNCVDYEQDRFGGVVMVIMLIVIMIGKDVVANTLSECVGDGEKNCLQL